MKRVALAAVVAAVYLVATAVPALAWHPNIAAEVICTDDFQYQLNYESWNWSDDNTGGQAENARIGIYLDGEKVAEGAYTEKNGFRFSGMVVPIFPAGDTVTVKAVAEVGWGPNQDIQPGQFREVTVSVPPCEPAATTTTAPPTTAPPTTAPATTAPPTTAAATTTTPDTTVPVTTVPATTTATTVASVTTVPATTIAETTTVVSVLPLVITPEQPTAPPAVSGGQLPRTGPEDLALPVGLTALFLGLVLLRLTERRRERALKKAPNPPPDGDGGRGSPPESWLHLPEA